MTGTMVTKGSSILDSYPATVVAYRAMAEWTTLQFTRRQVDDAGTALVDRERQIPDGSDALVVINNWRACHAFPLNTFQMGLRDRAKQVDEDAIVAQRIKRLSAIELKLRIMPRLRLTQMQDIGGCRAIVTSTRQVRRLHDSYKRSQIKHRLVHTDDYIDNPRGSGYRGVHLVYRYFSDRNSAYNGFKVEMQLRTMLQHAWATAVETVGTFKQQALKSGLGDEQWLRFFALMGSILAISEGSPLVPDTPDNRSALVRELRYYVDELKVLQHLASYTAILDAVTPPKFSKYPYFLLELRPREGHLSVTPYSRRDARNASSGYVHAEQEARSKSAEEEERDAVLVSVDDMNALRKAYPNYFADTKRFAAEVVKATRS